MLSIELHIVRKMYHFSYASGVPYISLLPKAEFIGYFSYFYIIFYPLTTMLPNSYFQVHFFFVAHFCRHDNDFLCD